MSCPRRLYLLFGLLILSAATTFAQNQDTNEPSANEEVLKPRLEIGVGRLAFYGDIGSNLSNYSPLTGNIGAHFRLGMPLNSYLEFDAFALYGRLSLTETTGPRYLNFSSELRQMGALVSYNFRNFLKPGSPIAPYISAGVSGFEFLSKTDMFNSNGEQYHYWSDGSIRNLPETAPNASEAIEIQRDYIYETDIRKLNQDGFGAYPERSWAIPVGVGATLDLTPSVRLRLGTEMHFTFTNYIDGVTENSTGNRAGNSANDRFMYTTASLSYNFSTSREKREKKAYYKGVDLLALEEGDEDADGISDFFDECPATPQGVKVDSRGCPLDADGDGVPDYLDQQPDTPKGAYVDPNGVAISDDKFYQQYLFWIDSLQGTTVRSKVETASVPPAKKTARPGSHIYRIKAENEAEMTSEMIERILSIPDVTAREVEGETIYLIGEYDELYKAVERKINLEADGISGIVVVDENGNLIDASEEAVGIEADLRRISDVDEKFDAELSAPTMDVVYRVQIGAFENPLSNDVFAGVPDLIVLKGADGLTRYVSGSFTNLDKAASHKVNLLVEGFEGAFITAYRGGKRITLGEAGAIVSGEDSRTQEVASPAFDGSLVKFRVQVGAYRGEVPTDVLDSFIELGEISPMRGPDGTTRYVFGNFGSYEDAQRAKENAVSTRFPDAFVVGEFNGNIVPVQEAIRIQNE